MKSHIATALRPVSIREIPGQCRINRWEMIKYSGTSVEVELKTGVSVAPEHERLTMTVAAVYTTSRALVERKLMEYTIEAVYEIEDLGHIVEASDDSVMIPPDLLSLLLSLSIGALRGMIALRTANTFLANYPLPIYRIDTLISNMAGGRRAGSTPMITIDDASQAEPA